MSSARHMAENAPLNPTSEASDDRSDEPQARPPVSKFEIDKSPPTTGAARAVDQPVDVAHVARSTVFAFILTGLGLGLNYLFNVALARWFGAAEFGLFATSISVINALVVVVIMGFDMIVLREVPAERAQHAGAGWRVLRLSLIIVLAVATSFALILGLLAQPIANRFFADAQGLSPILATFAIALPLMTAGALLLAGLQATRDVRLRLTVRYGLEPILRFAIGAIAYVAGAGIVGGVWAVIAASAATAFIALIGVRRRMPLRQAALPGGGSEGALLARLMRASWPLTLASIVLVCAGRADIVLLLGYSGAHETGLYGGALVTAAIITTILAVVETIAAPLLSEGIARSGARGVSDLYKLALRWTTLASVPIFLFFAIAAWEIMGLLGPEFRAAGLCFLILSAANLVNALTGSANYILLLGNKPGIVLANALLFGAVMVGGNALAVPLWGMIGAAGTLLLATTLINVARLIEVWLVFGIHPFSKESIGPALIGAALIGLDLVLEVSGLHLNGWIAAVIAVLIYGVLVLLSCLHPDDRRILGKAARMIRRRVGLG